MRSLILTANQRLARAFSIAHDRERERAGGWWSALAALPLQSWLVEQWRAGLHPQVLLNAAQELALWRSIVASSAGGGALLDINGAAQSAMSAWRLVHQYRVALDARFRAQEDTVVFLEWAAEYRRQCEARGWMDSARLPDAVRLTPLDWPEHLRLAGFDEFTPQQAELIDALRGAGCEVEQLAAERQPAPIQRVGCLDSAHELEAAAEWAREGYGKPCAIVLLTPVKPSRIERVFGASLGPERPFHISIPEPLTQSPLVAAALLVLKLAAEPRWTLDDAGLLLRSPFIAGGNAESAARALADARLRRYRRDSIPVAAVLRAASACPIFARVVSAWSTAANRGPATCSEWAARFRDVLSEAGWPGDRTLSSGEYQVFQAFLELFQTFSSLDVVSGPMPFAAAMDRFAALAATTRFQPQDTGAPLQIMGVLEAAGSQFDSLWVVGAGAHVWPAPSHPHPFIPLAIQRERNLPHCSPARELDFARRTLARLAASTGEMQVSWPRSEGDAELRPSPLIAGFEEMPAGPLSIAMAPLETESIVDELAPPFEGTRPTGGTSVIRDQAACPFRAFAKRRLDAQPLDEADPGLSSSERGSIVHDALKMFWDRVRDRAALVTLSARQLDEVARECAQAAAAHRFLDQHSAFDTRLRALEIDRVRRLVVDQAEFEKARPPFAVTAREGNRVIALAGLELDARIDRVDRLPDGSELIIDYKTTPPKLKEWDPPRPSEPQLPLYALSNEAPVGGLAFACVGSDGPGFTGYTVHPDVLPGVKVLPRPMEEQLAGWRTALEGLATAFRAGAAAVNPLKTACEYCGLTPLCRVHEAEEARHEAD